MLIDGSRWGVSGRESQVGQMEEPLIIMSRFAWPGWVGLVCLVRVSWTSE